MREGRGYIEEAVEKGGDANVAERKTLTEKQELFCRYCAEGKRPKEAAKLAGYRQAETMAKKMMQMSKIQKAIEKRKCPKREKPEEETAVAEKEEILCFLTEMMREDDDPKLRMKAAELLGKRESLFEREKKPEGKSRIIIVDDLP